MKRHRLISLLCLFAVCTALVIGEETPEREELRRDPVSLREQEILEYEGEKLSPIDTSFRENSISGPQHIDREEYSLRVDGLVRTPTSLSYEEVLAHNTYKKVITLQCITGWSARVLWEGVLLRDIIDAAGRTDAAAVVILHAYDDYTTSFPIEFFYEKDILMAYKINDVELPPERGFPFPRISHVHRYEGLSRKCRRRGS